MAKLMLTRNDATWAFKLHSLTGLHYAVCLSVNKKGRDYPTVRFACHGLNNQLLAGI